MTTALTSQHNIPVDMVRDAIAEYLKTHFDMNVETGQIVFNVEEQSSGVGYGEIRGTVFSGAVATVSVASDGPAIPRQIRKD